jgi:DNA replication protein DnaC
MDTGCRVSSYDELLKDFEATGSEVPQWLLDKLSRRTDALDADRLHELALQAGVPERYAWAVADQSRNAQLAEGTSYYLHGISGDGKSTRAAGMLKGWLCSEDATAVWARAVALFPEISDTYGGEGTEGEVMARYASCGLLVIDDLGKENTGKWSLSKLFDLIDRRYGSHLPTIITSQHAPDELGQVMADTGSTGTAHAIIGRMRESYRAIHCGDTDHRLGTKGEA